MSIAFSGTLASLSSQRYFSSHLVAGLVVAILFAWFAWFFFAPITLLNTSKSARVEVASALHPIYAPIGGQISEISMALGREATEGDVLLELDSSVLRLELDAKKAQRDSIHVERLAMDKQIKAIARSIELEEQAHFADLDGARSRVAEAGAQLKFSSEQLTRIETLNRHSNVSELELIKAQSELSEKESVVQIRRSELARLEKTKQVRKSDREAELQGLRVDFSRLERQLISLESDINERELDLKKYKVKAPSSGKVGQISDLLVGMHIQKGAYLGVFVPKDTLLVKAQFSPDQAFGHISIGQVGKLLLDGFPLTQFRNMEVKVTNVAHEIMNGNVQVELAVNMPSVGDILLEHGMPATVQIETKRVVPLTLVLNAVGKLE